MFIYLLPSNMQANSVIILFAGSFNVLIFHHWPSSVSRHYFDQRGIEAASQGWHTNFITTSSYFCGVRLYKLLWVSERNLGFLPGWYESQLRFAHKQSSRQHSLVHCSDNHSWDSKELSIFFFVVLLTVRNCTNMAIHPLYLHDCLVFSMAVGRKKTLPCMDCLVVVSTTSLQKCQTKLPKKRPTSPTFGMSSPSFHGPPALP